MREGGGQDMLAQIIRDAPVMQDAGPEKQQQLIDSGVAKVSAASR